MAQLVELGQRYGLLSSATSYVAVEERSAADKTTTQAVLRKIPIAITQGWHGRGSVLPSMALPAGILQQPHRFSRPGSAACRRAQQPLRPQKCQAIYGALTAQSTGETTSSLLGRPLGSGRTSRQPV